MKKFKENLRYCKNGHTFYKNSDCPTCPACETMKKPKEGFLSLMSAPARRALEREGILTLKKLSKYTEEEILEWHGMGPASIPILKKILKSEGLTFRK